MAGLTSVLQAQQKTRPDSDKSHRNAEDVSRFISLRQRAHLLTPVLWYPFRK